MLAVYVHLHVLIHGHVHLPSTGGNAGVRKYNLAIPFGVKTFRKRYPLAVLAESVHNPPLGYCMGNGMLLVHKQFLEVIDGWIYHGIIFLSYPLHPRFPD